MLSSMKMQASKNPAAAAIKLKQPLSIHRRSSTLILRLQQQPPALRFSSLSLQISSKEENASSSSPSSMPSISSSFSDFTSSTVGSPPSSLQWNLITPRHITLLNIVACSVAVSTTWLFCSAIPTLLAFKRAAESLEKLMDVTREELPDTMAAVRLSGMEISDLTMELSDLGQEITQGVRSSTRAVRVAEERLRRLTNMPPSASLQVVANPKAEPVGPVLARNARNIREGIVKSRAFFQIFLSLVQYSRMALNFFASRAKQ